MFEMDRDAFEELYAEHARPLVRFLMYRTGDAALAEDIAADTFERVLRARRSFDPRKASKKTWLYAIALNALRDHQRRLGAEARALDRVTSLPSQQEDGPFEELAVRAAVAAQLALLARDEREAVALRYGADLSVAEIARVTGARPATVEKRLYRALAKMRQRLSEDALRSTT